MSGRPRAGGYAVRGSSHIRKDLPCQDAVRVTRMDAERGAALAAAVADGHGSSVHADVGARLAVEVGTEHLLAFYEALSPERRLRLKTVLELAQAPTRRQLVQTWAERVGEVAGEEVSPELLRQYGATLLAVLVTPEFVLFGQIGDGDILQLGADGHVRRPLPKDPQAFADETPSLCQKEAWLQMRMAIQPPPAGESLLMLSTDGYSNSYEDDATFERIGPDYLKLVRDRGLDAVLEQLPSFLDQVSRRGSGDDVTLALVHFKPEEKELMTCPDT